MLCFLEVYLGDISLAPTGVCSVVLEFCRRPLHSA